MKTILYGVIITALIPVLFSSCTSTSTSKLISIEDYTFARTGENDQLVTIEDPALFKRGEAVHLVLLNVGPFKKDSTGLNWFDIDMEVTGPDGSTVISEKGLLGDNGHLNLDNNMASSPYSTCYTTEDLAVGEYKFKMTIYDRIGSGKATQTATFKLE